MKKRLLLASLAAMLVLCFAIPAASAATDKELDKLYTMVDQANAKIASAVEKAQKTEEDDVDELLAYVDEVTAPVFSYADSIDVKVKCKYDKYIIDGQRVKIDPLRVVNVGTGTGGTK